MRPQWRARQQQRQPHGVYCTNFMNTIEKVAEKVGEEIGERALGVAIEIDRAGQEVIFNRGIDWTISGVSNSQPGMEPLKDVLNTIQPEHTENAARNDTAQQEALAESEGKS